MKSEEIYNEKYGDIPDTYGERIEYLYSKSKNLEKLKKEVENRIKDIQSIEWGEYNYTMHVLPKATPRPRTTSKGNFFYVKGAADNKKYFKKHIMQSDWDIITTPTVFHCTCYFPTPSNLSQADKVLAEMGYINNISMPDFDNLAKTYTDMLKGILLYDDRLVISGAVKKRYSIKPRVEVVISYMKDFDSNYNRKKITKALEAMKMGRG